MKIITKKKSNRFAFFLVDCRNRRIVAHFLCGLDLV